MKTDEAFRYRCVLTVAGSDSGGGAGIQADLKTFSALGCYGMSAITAITAQNTCGVNAVSEVSIDMLQAQVDAVFGDMAVDALKIGMMPTFEHVNVIASAIDHYDVCNIVLDPVLASTSGAALMDAAASASLAMMLFHRVDLITPNLDEAGRLLGREVVTRTDMESAAFDLIHLGARAVLIKGGHLPGATVADLLVTEDGGISWMQGSRIATQNTHGTGCTLSSAIAAYLAKGESIEQAVAKGREFVRQALTAGAASKLGEGNGPLNHGFAPMTMHASKKKN